MTFGAVAAQQNPVSLGSSWFTNGRKGEAPLAADVVTQPPHEASEPQSRFRGFSLNDRDSDPFPRAVGALLANFGSVEMLSHVWLSGISTDTLLAKELERTPFSKRVGIIIALAEAGRIPVHHLPDAKSVWSRARQISELRNQVTHNPVILGWNGTQTDGPPHILGVVDRRKSAISSTIGLAEINAAVDATAALAQEIHKLGQVIEGEKAWPFQSAITMPPLLPNPRCCCHGDHWSASRSSFGAVAVQQNAFSLGRRTIRELRDRDAVDGVHFSATEDFSRARIGGRQFVRRRQRSFATRLVLRRVHVTLDR